MFFLWDNRHDLDLHNLIIVLQGKLYAVYLFVGESFDCSDVAQGLCSHVAKLSLGILVCDSEWVKEGGTDASYQDLRQDECHDYQSQLNVVGEHDTENNHDDASRFDSHHDIRWEAVLDDLSVRVQAR